jgi:hypothetical protein
MKKKTLAPIAIFVYRRKDYLKLLINSLKKNILSKKSIIYIFSDGWNDNSDKPDVLSIRKYISKIRGFKKINIINRKENFGLSKNIISGINFVLNDNNKIIVLEDDLELSSNFLNYMNDALNIYKNNKKVASVNGWSFPINFKKNTSDYFFIRGADCWGWGTWKRAWKKLNPSGRKLLNRIKYQNLKKLFNFNNTYDYFKMLEDQIVGKNNSWAIRWYASIFLENMYTLYPKISLVNNNGTNNGTHSNFDTLNLGSRFIRRKYKYVLKQKVKEDLEVREQIELYFKKNYFLKIKKFFKILIKG